MSSEDFAYADIISPSYPGVNGNSADITGNLFCHLDSEDDDLTGAQLINSASCPVSLIEDSFLPQMPSFNLKQTEPAQQSPLLLPLIKNSNIIYVFPESTADLDIHDGTAAAQYHPFNIAPQEQYATRILCDMSDSSVSAINSSPLIGSGAEIETMIPYHNSNSNSGSPSNTANGFRITEEMKSPNTSSLKKKKRKTKSSTATSLRKPRRSTKRCSQCGTDTAPAWRRGPNNESLCNACGLYMKMHGKAREMVLEHGQLRTRRLPKPPRSYYLECDASETESHHQQQQYSDIDPSLSFLLQMQQQQQPNPVEYDILEHFQV